MIVGEAEIQGQVKRAYELALVEAATGPILNRLFRGALAAGKRARSETAVSEKGVSISSVAVELAQRAKAAGLPFRAVVADAQASTRGQRSLDAGARLGAPCGPPARPARRVGAPVT